MRKIINGIVLCVVILKLLWFLWILCYTKIGDVKFRHNNLEGALAVYTRLVAWVPKDPNAYTRRGYTKWWLGDVSGAMRDSIRAIELDSNNASIA